MSVFHLLASATSATFLVPNSKRFDLARFGKPFTTEDTEFTEEIFARCCYVATTRINSGCEPNHLSAEGQRAAPAAGAKCFKKSNPFHHGGHEGSTEAGSEQETRQAKHVRHRLTLIHVEPWFPSLTSKTIEKKASEVATSLPFPLTAL